VNRHWTCLFLAWEYNRLFLKRFPCFRHVQSIAIYC
jgi:hypothetical protein